MRVYGAAVLLFFACPLPCYSQASTAPQYGSIIGLVVDDANKPVSRAIVTLSTTGAKPQDAVAWTDESGRFAFGYLPPGSYQLRASTPGGTFAAFGSTTRRTPTPVIHIRAGENRTDLVCRLPRTASISGAVLDSDGSPANGVNVMALQPLYRRGVQRFVQMANSAVDSQGRYHLSNLRPGKYAVCLHTWNQGFVGRSEASAKETSQHWARTAQCYPGTEDIKSAALITVQSAKDVSGIDLQTTLRKSIELRGHVQTPDNFDGPKASLNVFAIELNGVPNGARFYAPLRPDMHEFQFPPLPPGKYAVVAVGQYQGKHYRGVQEISADADSNNDITVALDRGVDISGRVQVVGPDAAEHMPQYVTFTPGDNLNVQNDNPRARVQTDGTFKIENVPPGIWDINVSPLPRGGYIKSIMLGKQDVLTEEMRITSTTSAPLNIIVGTKAGTVKGDVVDAAKQPCAGVVVLAPEGKWHGVFSFYGWTQTDDEGHFEITGVTPGPYKLYAFDQYDMNSQGPDGLDAFEQHGLRIDVKEAETVSQNVNIIAASGVTQ